MKVLVTGANGLLGHHLVAALQARGDSVQALVLPNEDVSRLQEHSVAVYRGDIRQPETLAEPMQGVEGVFHLAAMMGAWRSMEDYNAVNVKGTENVCRAALTVGVKRLVHISSAMVYRLWSGVPVTEEAPLMPLNEPYAMSKAEGDRLVQKLIARDGLPATIVRPGTLFGPGDRMNFGRIADRVRSGKAVIVGSGRNPVPFVYVTDVVDALLLAFDSDRALGQAYNVGHDEPLTQAELIGAISRELGCMPPTTHVPYLPLLAAGWVAERVSALGGYRWQPPATRHGVRLYGGSNRISIEKARRDLGYAPRVALREGIRIAATWYREHVLPSESSLVLNGNAANTN